MLRLIFAVWFAAIMVPAPVLAADEAAWSEAALDRAFARLDERKDLQRTLPDPEAKPEPEPDKPPPEPEDKSEWDWDLEWLRPVLPYIAGALAIVVLGLMFPGARRWINSRGQGRGQAQPDTVSADAPQITASLAEADALAAAGDYARACAALLVYILPRLAGAFHARWKPSITAREALRLLKLPTDAHELLAFVVGMSETGRFAGGSVGGEEYSRSRLCIVELQQIARRAQPLKPQPPMREAGHG